MIYIILVLYSMNTKEELEKKLAEMRLKWKVYPKSYLEPNWWKFKCDSVLATRLKTQIEKTEQENKNGSEIAKDIFGT